MAYEPLQAGRQTLASLSRDRGSSSIIDVLDRVLDKGIVIDAYIRVGVVGIDLLVVDARIVVASIDTYLHYSDLLDGPGSVRQFNRVAPPPAQQADSSGGPPPGSARPS